MRIITSSSRYIDIDAYAGIVVYTELLQAQGVPARGVTFDSNVARADRLWLRKEIIMQDQMLR